MLPILGCDVLTSCGAGSTSQAVPLALSDADGLLVAPGALYDGPDEGASPVGTLARLTRVRLSARGTVCHLVTGDTCAERWLLAGTTTWVDGHALAVAQASPLLDTNLGGNYLAERPVPSDGSRAPAVTWFGVQTVWEWNPDVGRERVAATGWLAAQTPDGLRAVPLGMLSGWGSAQVIIDRRWIDLDVDGAAELIVVSRANLTEAGYNGQQVRVLGADLTTRLDLEVGDPVVNGLGQTAWGAVRLEGAELVREALEAVPCVPGLPVSTAPNPGTGASTCFTATRVRWTKLRPSAEPLVVRAGDAPVLAWYHPEGRAPSTQAPVRVLLQRGKGAAWVDAPTLSPAWVGGVFAADREHQTWAALWPP